MLPVDVCGKKITAGVERKMGSLCYLYCAMEETLLEVDVKRVGLSRCDAIARQGADKASSAAGGFQTRGQKKSWKC